MRVTESGTTSTPSLQDSTTHRPFHVSDLEGTDWEVEVSFADIWYANGDGEIDFSDLVFVAIHFGETAEETVFPCPDVNRDGIVDICDLVLVGSHFAIVKQSDR